MSLFSFFQAVDRWVPKVFEELLQTRIEALTRASGAQPGGVIRAPEHLHWFIWYQVEKLEYRDIVKRLENLDPRGIGTDAVAKAARHWGDLLDLAPRKIRFGRPPRGEKQTR